MRINTARMQRDLRVPIFRSRYRDFKYRERYYRDEGAEVSVLRAILRRRPADFHVNFSTFAPSTRRHNRG